MNAWTRVSASGSDNIGRILDRLRRWKKADFVMLLMCGMKDSDESKTTPRFLIVGLWVIGQPSRFSVVLLYRWIFLTEPTSSISDLSEFRSKKLCCIQDLTSFKQVSRLWRLDESLAVIGM